MPNVSASLCVVLALAGLAVASPIVSIADLPTSYSPGGQVSFRVVLIGAQNLAAYNIDVALTAQNGTPGVDASFATPLAPTSTYVFGTDTVNFLGSLNHVGSAQVLNLSDFHDPSGTGSLVGVNTQSGANDLVASVTIQTQASLAGKLYLAIDASSLELDTPQTGAGNTPIPINGFAELRTALAAASPTEVPEVPEPASLCFLVAAACLVLQRRGNHSRSFCT